MAVTAFRPILPPEVVEHTIDFLQGDRESLSNCALVCRTWLPRAHYHRFASITLPIASHGIYARHSGLARLLDHNPDLASYIQSLTLEGVDFLGRAVRWDTTGGAFTPSRVATLRALSLSRIELPSLSVLVPLICTLPLLEELALHCLRVEPSSSAGTSRCTGGIGRHRAARALKVLAFTGEPIGESILEADSAAFASALLDAGAIRAMPAGSLTSLSLLSGGRGCAGWLPFLPFVGTSLQHCAVSLYDPVGCAEMMENERDNVLHVFDALRSSTALRSLCIQYNATSTLMRSVFAGTTHGIPVLSPSFLHILQEILREPKVPFPYLETLSVIFIAPAYALPECMDALVACVRVLCGGRFPLFSHVSIRVDEPSYLKGLFNVEDSGAEVIDSVVLGLRRAGVHVDTAVTLV